MTVRLPSLPRSEPQNNALILPQGNHKSHRLILPDNQETDGMGGWERGSWKDHSYSS